MNNKIKNMKLPVYINYLRSASTGLLDSHLPKSAESVVVKLLALQAQSFYSFQKAILIRSDRLDGEDVKSAFQNLKTVRWRPMRGTLHITHAQDYHWMRVLLRRKESAYEKRLKNKYKLDKHIISHAFKIAESLFNERGSLDKQVFYDALAYEFKSHLDESHSLKKFSNFLLFVMDGEGLLVEGPIEKNSHRLVNATLLPAADSAQSAFKYVGESSDNAALEYLAFRYVKGHGPVSAYDLARWADITVSSARCALKSAWQKELVKSYFILDSELVENKRTELVSDALFMCDESLEIFNNYKERAAGIYYLPAFDELHVGYMNRSCLTDEAGEDLICKAKNGAFKPIIMKNGRLIGVDSAKGYSWYSEPSENDKRRIEEIKNSLALRFGR